jgi:hypothetical protein
MSTTVRAFVALGIGAGLAVAWYVWQRYGPGRGHSS